MDGLWIDPLIMELNRSASERILFARICYRAAIADGSCKDSNPTLAQATGLSKNSIPEMVQRLEQAGLITSVVNKDQANQRSITPIRKYLIGYKEKADRYKEKADSTYEEKADSLLGKTLEPITENPIAYKEIPDSLYKDIKPFKTLHKTSEEELLLASLEVAQTGTSSVSIQVPVAQVQVLPEEEKDPSTPSSARPPSPKNTKPVREPTPINIPFEAWWEAYDKRVDRKVCEPKWNKLTDAQRQAALTHTGRYVLETPNPKFRKNPETYLNRESWNNEPQRYEPDQNQYGTNSRPNTRPVAPAHQSAEQRADKTRDIFAAIDSAFGR